MELVSRDSDMLSVDEFIRMIRKLAPAALMAGALVLPGTLTAQAQGPQGAPSAMPAEVQEEIQRLQQQMQQIEERLSSIQQQAASHPEIVELNEKFNTKVIARMTEINPETEGQIEEQRELVDELVAMGNYQELEGDQRNTYEQKVQEYQQIQNNLQQAQAQAMQDSTVQQLRDQLNDKLVERMTEIDDSAEELIERREQLIARFEQIRQQMGSPTQGMPGSGG